jgi:uncharacterized OB-fold protein
MNHFESTAINESALTLYDRFAVALGWLLERIWPRAEFAGAECPECHEQIAPKALFCPYCGRSEG